MNRKHFTFACDGAELVGSLDMAAGSTGLLIVSGGNEVRAGPWGSQAQLADRIAASGFPVLRFDRRGIGDSEGANAGFTDSGPDIAAAIRAFRNHVPTLRKVVAYGNCDAASALMLNSGEGCDALVLANPWTFDPEPEAVVEAPSEQAAPTPMPPTALRSYYLRRLFNLAAWKRLLGGKVKVTEMAASLVEAVGPDGPPSNLAQEMAAGLEKFAGPATILLAENDRTAQAFKAAWDKNDPRLRTCPGAGHSFVEPQARIWLQGQILAALRGL
ncbi:MULTISPECIES: hydrolase 1, exosortase A system-associated [unclassified Novosphingobium]|uniref:hydrolase 1, exosortase A system-associated n=1 Tax=unclassified Novosphingobium TaxID=2644732 RepID=UPI0025EDD09D|nr:MULTISPECIES: hydrolase 1, exosortase A system-associated [unclassified Novosphingobium]HQV02589.1 hydrolase 1, exosortase A system-associated [Novosphingobium sp.]